MKRSILKVVLSTALLTSVGFGSELVLSGTKVEFSKELSLHKLEAASTNKGDILTVIQTKESLSDEQKDKLYSAGAKTISYAGVNSYYVLANIDDIQNISESIDSFDKIAVLEPEHKIAKELKDISINDQVKIKVSFVEQFSLEEVEEILNSHDIEYKEFKYNEDFASLEVIVDGLDVERLAALAEVKEIAKYHEIGLIKPFSKTLETMDLSIIESTNTDSVVELDTDLDGSNVPIGVVDEGEVYTEHQEFKQGYATRIRDRANGSTSAHSTHVAGIIGSQGVTQKAKGMAVSAQIYSYIYEDLYFASALTNLASSDILLTNHSYGFTDNADLGVYNSDAANEDKAVYNNPYINMFLAAGNDRTRSGYPDTMIIKGAGNAKNIFTIGALDYDSESIAYYSSVGPAKDGRIKPDLVIKGSSVYSTSNVSQSSYTYMTGTSMATPAATGIAALVMQEYKELTNCGNNRGCDMRHDVLKAVLINTAIDKEATGPDIYTGYGMINAKEAIETVKSLDYLDEYDGKQKIKLDSLAKGAQKEYSFSIDEAKDFKVTVSWVDPAGNSASSAKALVNDLDTYVLNKSTGAKFYPYSLNLSDPTAHALQDRPNSVDNTEKIEINNLPAGDYVLVVDATNIQTSSQEYAIASSELMFEKSQSIINSTQKVKLELNSFAKVMLDSIF